MALSLFADPFFGDPFFGGGLGDVFSALPAGCSITTDVGDAGGGGGSSRDTGGRRRARAIPIDLIEACRPSHRPACMHLLDHLVIGDCAACLHTHTGHLSTTCGVAQFPDYYEASRYATTGPASTCAPHPNPDHALAVHTT